MKKFLSFLALAGLLLTASCSKQESPVLGEDQVTISLGLEGVSATRAISDGSQVDKLVYEVYDKNGNVLSAMDKSVPEPVVFPYTLSLPLAKGQQYKILFWAQDSDCSAYTTDNLKEVKIDYSQAPNNDETRDAFYAAVDVTVTGGPQSIDVVLKRPFAQINVAVPQDEWQRAIDAGVNVSQSSVVVSEVASKINLETGKVEVAPNGISYDFANIPTETLWVDINKDKVKDANETFVYLSMSYILVADESDNGAEKNIINNATFTFKTDVNNVTLSVPNLPVQRNYRTNVLGTFLVDYVDFNIVVDPIYNEPDEVYPDTNLENLYYAAANGGEVTLQDNVTLDATLNVTKPMVLNLNGKTITNKQENTTTDVIVVKPGARLEINGEGTVEAVSGNDGYAVISEGELVINGGTYKSGVDANNETNAVIYARGNGKVFVNGGEFPNDNLSGFVLNKKDGDRTTTTIEVRGGTFHKFNPGNNAAEGPGTNFVAEGYKSIANGDVYTVVEEDIDFVVTTDEQFKNALAANDKEINILLGADVAVDVAAWQNNAFGGAITETITIEAQGFTVTFNQTNSDWNNIVTNNNAKLIIKNANLTNSGYNNGPWNRHDLNFGCDVELINVKSDKAIALKANGILTDVTINDPNTSDTYALWIQPNGQTVTLDGCMIDMLACNDGRGIKIDEQYVDAPAKVILNISNTEFKTEEKAAIIVKSKAGADINLNNIDITEVAADDNNAVWVDEASKNYYDLVNVKGGSKVYESPVQDNAALANLAIKDGDYIFLAEGDFNIPASAKAKKLTIIGAGVNTVINVIPGGQGEANGQLDYNFDGSTVTFRDLTIKTNNQTYAGYARLTGTYVNCVMEQCYCLNGNSEFIDCKFNVSGNQYNLWTWGAPIAKFEKCVFNSDGKALLLYGTVNTKLTINNSVFNDSGVLTDLKAAIEIGDDYNKSYELIVNNTEVNGYEINTAGISTGTTLWANKNSMPKERLNVVVDGIDVY